MSEYKRLTGQKWSDNINLTQELGYSYIYQRLYELENKLENATLIEFPCKVGETCYLIMGNQKIKEAVVINFSIEAAGIYARVRFKDGIFLYTSIPELNKTYEQAEEKLKELQGKEQK